MADGRLQRQLSEHVAASVTGSKSHPPEAGGVYWSIFCDLHQARRMGQHIPDPITFSEIRAYADLMKWPFRPHDVDILRAMDVAYLAAVAQRTAGKPDIAHAHAQPITAAAFDAVFGR